MADEKTLSIQIRAQDAASATIGKINQQLTGMGNNIKGGVRGAFSAFTGEIGKMVLGFFAVQTAIDLFKRALSAAWNFIKEGVLAVGESNAANLLLGNSLTAAGRDAAAMTPQIQALAEQIMDLGVADDDAVIGAARLVSAHKMTDTQMLKTLDVAKDVARFLGVDYQTAVDMLTKGYEGQVRGLKGLGIEYDKTKGPIEAYNDVLEQARQKTEGVAEAYANTLPGALARAKLAWDEFKETSMRWLENSGLIQLALNDIADKLNQSGRIVKSWVEFFKDPTPLSFLGDVLALLISMAAVQWTNLKFMLDTLESAPGRISNAFGSATIAWNNFISSIQRGINIFAIGLHAMLTAMKSWIDTLGGYIRTAGGWFDWFVQLAYGVLKWFAGDNTLTRWAYAIYEGIRDNFHAAITWITALATAALAITSVVLPGMAGAFSSALGLIKGAGGISGRAGGTIPPPAPPPAPGGTGKGKGSSGGGGGEKEENPLAMQNELDANEYQRSLQAQIDYQNYMTELMDNYHTKQIESLTMFGNNEYLLKFTHDQEMADLAQKRLDMEIQFKDQMISTMGELTSSLITSFTEQAMGYHQAAGSIEKALYKILGTFAVTAGLELIVDGIKTLWRGMALNSLFPGIGTPAVHAGLMEMAKGAGLTAMGAAFGAMGSRRPGGGGGGGGGARAGAPATPLPGEGALETKPKQSAKITIDLAGVNSEDIVTNIPAFCTKIADGLNQAFKNDITMDFANAGAR